MIRFICKKTHGTCDHPKTEDFYTLDIEVPELERALRRGGYDQYGFEQHELVGVELRTAEKEPSDEKAQD